MKICLECGNTLQTRKVTIDFKGPKCSARRETQEYCEYCEWKGTTGPGKLLRSLIKEV
jgi:hypothetical protein